VLCFLDKQGRARRSNDHGQNQCVASRRLAETYNCYSPVSLKVSLEKRAPLTNTFPERHFQ
jgi:hypothetical protein